MAGTTEKNSTPSGMKRKRGMTKNMIQYQKIVVMKDDKRDKIVVEQENNTFEFCGCTMREVAEFMERIWEEE